MSTGNSRRLESAFVGRLDDVARRRIVAWLRASGRTQADLGRDIGRNQAWMSRFLDGEFDADLDTLQRIAVAFEHDITALLDAPKPGPDAEALSLFRALRPASRALALELLREWAHPPVTRGRSRARREGPADGAPPTGSET